MSSALMPRRRLGRTGHETSVLVLGGAAWGTSDVETVRTNVHDALDAGITTIDVAPSYGIAQPLLGQVLPEVRDRVFLCCKTGVRDRDGARAELEGSLSMLGTDQIDLYQLHAVTSDEELDAICAPGGALETLLAAKDEGLARFLGITGHFVGAPRVFARALQSADFDTVMLPFNAHLLGVPDYRRDIDALLEIVAERDLGVIALKAIARGHWPAGERRFETWYEPYEEASDVQAAVDWVLDQPISAFTAPGDVRLFHRVLAAVQAARPGGPGAANGAPLLSATG
jgi:aryl-alcohol dehydrogenase-like predicted oxidoreductase